MSYALARPPTLTLEPWRELTTTLSGVIRTINATASVICGRDGDGKAELTDDLISFNGSLLGRRWWRRQGTHRLMTDPVDDAHEDFSLERHLAPTRDGYLHTHVITGGKPYTIAVQATLLLVRYHYPDTTVITERGETFTGWPEALDLVTRHNPRITMPPECQPHLTRFYISPKMLRVITTQHRALP